MQSQLDIECFTFKLTFPNKQGKWFICILQTFSENISDEIQQNDENRQCFTRNKFRSETIIISDFQETSYGFCRFDLTFVNDIDTELSKRITFSINSRGQIKFKRNCDRSSL